MTTTLHIAPDAGSSLRGHINALRDLLGHFPVSILELLLRIGVALVFWKSAMTKLANWDITVLLFANEYDVPLLSPELAALLGTAVELAAPVMLVLGLGARFGAAALLGLVFVIQAFVYPENWSEHLLWASILLMVLLRGAGALSLDHLIARRWLDKALAAAHLTLGREWLP